jgi:ADP-ribosyl-[dinitrogen reductase] hydrolase
MNMYHQTAHNLIPAVAYGDAAGLPYEAQEPRPHGSLDGLRDTTTNPFIGEYPPGTWSDDTHLTLAVAKSLIAARGFDLESQADWHVEAYQHVKGDTRVPDMVPPLVTNDKQNGWGSSTTQSVERLACGISPRKSGEPGGAGNGILMKMSPLVAWQLGNDVPTADAEQQLVDLTRMTHDSPVAVITSLTHRRYLERISSGTDARTALVEAHQESVGLEEAFGVNQLLSDALGRIATDDFLEQPSRDKILTAQPAGRKPKYFGFFAPETLVMTYGSFVLERTLPKSVFRAVELGGDSDSTGSMVAAMSVFAGQTVGPELPDYKKIFDLKRLERISADLADRVGE